uniref:FkbH like protein n=1 Tax=Solibacter usitatus (strain Ellin6076) TaxID=234267 RepID=Q01XE0_SOLUE
MRELGLPGEIRFAAYNQVFQELLDPAGLFARNTTGANIVLVRFEDWTLGQAGEFVDAVRAAAGRLAVPLLIVLCAGTGEFDDRMRASVAGLPSVHLITAAEIAALYPVRDLHDPHANELGHVPYTPLYFVALATAIARKIHAITAPPFKVIALDCDDTLWAGICGEDGPEGVVLDPPRLALQQFMRARRQEGMLLALCSKNNEEDVAATFAAHPEMPLRLEDFAAQRVNWETKGANLVSLADELDLGLDSVILIDDNPKEVTEAQAGAPQALAIALPERAAEIPEFLRHVWAFDRARVTEEDRRRPELYAQRAERVRAQRSSASLEEFLASLKLEVAIAPLEAAQADRVAQLTQRTNQMNATCIRRTAAEIQRLAAECLTVKVTDRFGSYGLTGVILFRTDATALIVDTFLLSCRALGRGVEHRMVARLGEIAQERGLKRVELPFVEGQRNRPALLFLQSLAAQDPDGVFRLDAARASQVRYQPGAGKPADLPAGEGRPAAAVPLRIPYARIAAELREPEMILAHIRATSRRAAGIRDVEPPRTALERDLVELWAELLNVEALGVHENFFELGGHSLLAVQLLSRVRQLYGVELSLEVVYSGEFTVAELAKAIELKEIEHSGGDYHELLQELDGLSDEEVRALLAEEQDAS